MEWQPHTKRLADDSSYDQIARQGILEGNSQRHDLEDRQVTSLTRKAECDKGTAKANGKKTDSVDSTPRCRQSNQCGRKESSYIRSIDGGRAVAGMGTEEDDLPHRWRSSDATDKTTAQDSPSMKSFWSEGTEQDDDKVTKTGQSSTDQAGERSRGHTEAHAQIRSSTALGDEQSCETTRGRSLPTRRLTSSRKLKESRKLQAF